LHYSGPARPRLKAIGRNVTPTVEDDTAAKGGDEMPVFFVPGMSREEAEKAYENFPRPQYPQVHSTARRSKMDNETPHNSVNLD
jgi:hypothetical protein